MHLRRPIRRRRTLVVASATIITVAGISYLMNKSTGENLGTVQSQSKSGSTIVYNLTNGDVIQTSS